MLHTKLKRIGGIYLHNKSDLHRKSYFAKVPVILWMYRNQDKIHSDDVKQFSNWDGMYWTETETGLQFETLYELYNFEENYTSY